MKCYAKHFIFLHSLIYTHWFILNYIGYEFYEQFYIVFMIRLREKFGDKGW